MSKADDRRQHANVQATSGSAAVSSDVPDKATAASKDTKQFSPAAAGQAVYASKRVSGHRGHEDSVLWWWAIPVALLLLSISLQTAILMDVKPYSYQWVRQRLSSYGQGSGPGES